MAPFSHTAVMFLLVIALLLASRLQATEITIYPEEEEQEVEIGSPQDAPSESLEADKITTVVDVRTTTFFVTETDS